MAKSPSKKTLLGKFYLTYKILYFLNECACMNSELVKTLQIPKQNLQHWLNELRKQGLIERIAHGLYDITDIGKKTLRGYAGAQNKQLIRLENMHYKFPIIKNYDYLINHYRWPQVRNMNNMQIIDAKVFDFSIQIFASSQNPSLQIYCRQKLGHDIFEMMYEAKREAVFISEIIENNWKVKLGKPEPSMRPEWAIPNPIAEAVLTVTQSSQIRTPKGTFNRSKGRNADWEVTDLGAALKILDMPNAIERIENKVNLVITSLNPTYFL